MSKNQNPVNKYKKLKPSSPSSPVRQREVRASSPARSNGKPVPQKSAPEKGQLPQILMIVLLSIICLCLLALVLFFFQPGRIQLWQSKSSQGSSDGAVIVRLEPEEAEVQEPVIPSEILPAETPAGDDEKGNPPANNQTREARIYFVKVNAEGQISLKSVTRKIDFNNSPLAQTVDSLISGPGTDEINKGSLTLIPEGSRLLSARIESGTAYLNFNEAFRFNPLGREGYVAQLKQIVYTS
ncbi:GerMN domain-containing protein, partial [Oceanispirochaeta sp.]|uniref:GerMN domain-containing protein n=1 Tax=Oceanispirochaeta sp. TaxID=2035350 RepID=UPI0026259289